MSTNANAQQDPPPWWTFLPSPAATPNSISLQDMCALVRAYLSRSPSSRPAAPPSPSKDWLLVDVRRTDFEGGTVATSVNFPAQSLYHTRRAVWDVCRAGGVRKVVFFCGEWRREDSSRGARVNRGGLVAKVPELRGFCLLPWLGAGRDGEKFGGEGKRKKKKWRLKRGCGCRFAGTC